jgi:hypothetical protein
MALEPTADIRNEDRGSAVGWGAIFAAGFITLALEIMFFFLASAVSFTAFNPATGGNWSSAATWWEAIYFLVTAIISFYVGGYAAGRLCGVKLRGSAMLHGLAAWGLVVVFVTYSFATGLGSLIGGAVDITGSAAGRIASGVVQNPKATARLQSKQAQSKIQQKAGKIQQNVNAKQAAGKVTNVIAGGSWFAFIMVICTGVFAVIGAAVGSRNPRKARRPEGLRAA